eukprot:gene1816-4112_t
MTIIYLIPGHTHMQADRTVAHSKKALTKRQMWVPEMICAGMNEVKGITAEIIKGAATGRRGECMLFEWADVLAKHICEPPPGFTKYYSWHIKGNMVTFKNSFTDLNPVPFEWNRIAAQSKRALILADLVRLGANKNPCAAELLKLPLKLPITPPRELNDSKVKSIAEKVLCTVPEQFRKYFPAPLTPVKLPA